MLSGRAAQTRSQALPSTASFLFIKTEMETVEVVQRLDGGGLVVPMPVPMVERLAFSLP
jgi:hypothetical protein